MVDLTDPAAPGRAPTAPLAVVGVELGLVPPGFDPMSGSAELLGLQATASENGDAGWSPVAVSGATSGWHWDRTDDGAPDPYPTTAGRPNLVTAGGGVADLSDRERRHPVPAGRRRRSGHRRR